MRSRIFWRRIPKVALQVGALSLAVLVPACRQPEPPGDYVSPQTCISCHPAAYAKWSGSHHDRAMQVATDSTVLGDFNNATFTHFGVRSRFFRRDGKFLVNTEGPDGALHDYEIKYTFGFDPLQQYLIAFPGGRLQCLGIAWDARRQKWFSLYPDQRLLADDPLLWTGSYQTWNHMCAECHSTNLQKHYDPQKDTYRTTWSALDVSCQACHGPGRRHVEWSRRFGKGGTRPDTAMGLRRNLAATPGGLVEICAPCHSRRQVLVPDDAPGMPYYDNFLPSTLREGLYFPDGQILDEVYVFGSFLQSKMARAGVSCIDCHDAHSLQLVRTGNALCTQCHQPSPPARFPTLARKPYDSPEHHFHKPGSDGARCVNCHMPARTYMQVDPRRDHSFTIPRPDLTAVLGVPNACTGCHAGKDAAWAQRSLRRWYGTTAPSPHFALAIAAGRAGKPEAGRELRLLAGDPAQAGIVRATAIELLRSYGDVGVQASMQALQDPDPFVRAVAVGGLGGLPAPSLRAVVAPFLRDSVRAVRLEAARLLAAVPPRELVADLRGALQREVAAYRQAMLAHSDQPGPNMNLALLYERRQQPDSALVFYRRAIRRDSFFTPAYLNLANLLNRLQRNPEAEETLRRGLIHAPQEGQLHYAFGLLLAEENRLPEAVESLAKAAQRLPDRARVRYNFALALQHLGRREQAEKELLATYRLAAGEPDIVYALAVFYVQDQRWPEALRYVQVLERLLPGLPAVEQLKQQIRARGGKG